MGARKAKRSSSAISDRCILTKCNTSAAASSGGCGGIRFGQKESAEFGKIRKKPLRRAYEAHKVVVEPRPEVVEACAAVVDLASVQKLVGSPRSAVLRTIRDVVAAEQLRTRGG